MFEKDKICCSNSKLEDMAAEPGGTDLDLLNICTDGKFFESGQGEAKRLEPFAGEGIVEIVSCLDKKKVREESVPLHKKSGVSSNRYLGIRLHKAGQIFFFADDGHVVRVGSKVVVDFEQGIALGTVESIITLDGCFNQGLSDSSVPGRVIGLATARDIALQAENSILAAEATAFCKTCIRQHSLEMKLVYVSVLHDRSKIIFSFTAPSRIDFRELVKDLVRMYRTRIELHQIGVRHETQMMGGIGNCGSMCCCHRFLRKFAPVTIKMAKEQNLFLNPAKLSGMCGRLLCCLSFEQGNYEEFNRRCPKLGKKYVTNGLGTVKTLRTNIFTQSIIVQTANGEESEMPLDEWEALAPSRAETSSSGQARQVQIGRPNGERRDKECGTLRKDRGKEKPKRQRLSDARVDKEILEPGSGKELVSAIPQPREQEQDTSDCGNHRGVEPSCPHHCGQNEKC